jgi:hypothetical protein
MLDRKALALLGTERLQVGPLWNLDDLLRIRLRRGVERCFAEVLVPDFVGGCDRGQSERRQAGGCAGERQ